VFDSEERLVGGCGYGFLIAIALFIFVFYAFVFDWFLWSLNWILDLIRKDAFQSIDRVEGNQRLLGFPVDFVFDCVFGFVFD
jgi:hypothetical protein